MGYESEVALAIRSRHEPAMLGDSDIPQLLSEATRREKNDGLLFHWGWVKWYSSDEQVGALHRFLCDLEYGVFDIPVDNIYASPILLGDLWKHNYDNLVVVSPDVGGVVRARALAKRMDAELAIIDKRRPRANVSEVMHIIGEVEGRNCVIMDDMVDTANTLCQAAQALRDQGALRVMAYAAHPVLSGKAVDRLTNSVIDELVVTDTIPLSPAAAACPKIRQLSCAALLGETITRIAREDSVSSLFREGRSKVQTYFRAE